METQSVSKHTQQVHVETRYNSHTAEETLKFPTRDFTMGDPKEPPAKPNRRNLQFGIRSLLLLMLLSCVLAAMAAGLVGYGRDGLSGNYVVFCIAAPIGLMMLLSLLEPAGRLWRRFRDRRRSTDEDASPF